MNEIELIRQKIDIVELIGNYLELKKAGSNYKALCPFHDEKTPSFMVSPEKQIFKCFGCSEGGSVFDFLMKYENLEFPEALRILADKAGVTLIRRRPRPGEKPDQKTRLYKINLLVSQIFHKILTGHPVGKRAREYLKKRQVRSETIELFQLGYAPGKKGWLETFLKSRGFSQKEIDLAGAPQRFFNRLIFPLHDQMGNVVGFTGRSLDEKTLPKYLNTPETPLFHKSRLLYGYPQARQTIKQKKYTIIAEGQMDVILAHQAGTNNTVAPSGTALTPEHLRILSRITSNLILAFDQDEAGQKAASRAMELAQNFELNLKLVRFPRGVKDPGEIIVKDTQAWKQALKDSLYFIEWILENTLAKIKGKPSIAQKKEIFKQILPQLKIIKDPIEQNHWVKILADRLNTSQESVMLALERISSSSPAPSQKAEAPPKPKPPRPEDLAIGILAKYPRLKSKHRQLYKRLAAGYNKEELAQFQLLAEQTYPEFSQTDLAEEILRLENRLEDLSQEKLKADFAAQIARAEEQGDRSQVKKLLGQLQAKLE
jgi:DNA primase